MNRTRKQRRVFSVTWRQIWFGIFVVAIGMTVAFEIGVSVGKKRIISAERESPLQENDQVSSVNKMSNEMKLPGGLSQTKSTEPSEALSEVDEQKVQYAVQVGTYRSLQGADKMVKMLQSYEYSPWLRTEPGKDNTPLHSVLVGRFDTRDEAERYGSAMVKSLSYVDSYMIREINE